MGGGVRVVADMGGMSAMLSPKTQDGKLPPRRPYGSGHRPVWIGRGGRGGGGVTYHPPGRGETRVGDGMGGMSIMLNLKSSG